MALYHIKDANGDIICDKVGNAICVRGYTIKSARHSAKKIVGYSSMWVLTPAS